MTNLLIALAIALAIGAATYCLLSWAIWSFYETFDSEIFDGRDEDL